MGGGRSAGRKRAQIARYVADQRAFEYARRACELEIWLERLRGMEGERRGLASERLMGLSS